MNEVHFAVPMAGAVLNALNIRLDAPSIAFQLDHGGAKIILVDPEFSGVIAEALTLMKGPRPFVIDVDDATFAGGKRIGEIEYEAALAQGDEAFGERPLADEWDAIALSYTSGTTGNPKGVLYHHRGAYLNALGNTLVWDFGRHPVYLWTLPMFHCNGWCFVWTLAALAGTNVCLRRVEAAGCSVIVLTVDNTTGRNSETYLRTRPKDLTRCAGCHKGEPFTDPHEFPMYNGIDMKGVAMLNPAMDWAFADRLRKFWKGKFLIKGIDTREDARLSIEHGLDGIVVSNHGGRATETSRGTIEALPEVVAEVGNRVPVFLDGGVRRGTDVFKALALGAKGVGIGRPMLWGLGAFGQPGVDRVLEILQVELKLVMGNCGTQKVADINRAYVATPNWKI
jgi:hypothetical protein